MKLVEKISNEIKKDKYISYSTEYSNIAKGVGASNRMLSSSEHSLMSEIDFSSAFSSRNAWFSWYFRYLKNIKNVALCGMISEIIINNNYKSIISFGAGPGVLEQIVSLICPEVDILATDYDDYMVKQFDKLKYSNVGIGGKIHYKHFDFYKDDIDTILEKDKDLVILIGSACSMDNNRYKFFLKQLNNSNVRMILTFEAGITNSIIEHIRTFRIIIKTVKRMLFGQEMRDVSSAHAFRRTNRELANIYSNSGWFAEKLEPIGTYRYVYALTKPVG